MNMQAAITVHSLDVRPVLHVLSMNEVISYSFIMYSPDDWPILLICIVLLFYYRAFFRWQDCFICIV